jgi:Cu2+-exporting ATPase
LAHELAHAALRRRGVFLRDGTFLDRALDVRKVLFDKTGTLTSGRLTLLEPGRGVLQALPVATRQALHAMVARSNHPASRCLLSELETLGEMSAPAAESALEENPGRGLELVRDGHTYRLGRPDFAAPGPAADPTATCLAVDGRPVASFAFAEEVKEDVAAEVAALEAAGRQVYLLSGDRNEKVRAAARAIGLDPARCSGELTPEAKAERVSALDRGDTFMVGDGINDASSFAAAHCTATPAVDRPSLPAAADLYFLGAGVAAVRQSLVVAARVRRVVRANLVFAVLYNAVALGLCLAGVVRPLVAAVLMPASSLLVVAHTVARLRFGRVAWTS